MKRSPELSTEQSTKRHVIVDVETTGLSAANGGRVIEIGAVAVEDGKVIAELGTLINTRTPIHYGAQRVHGISSEMLRGKPEPENVWPVFLEFVSDSPLVAHNSPFDRGFILHELSLLNLHLPNPWHCTVRLSRKCLPHLPNHKLETVARYLLGEIPTDCRLHRALDDARITANIWNKLIKKS